MFEKGKNNWVLIAQDVQEIFPNLVLADENSDLSLNYISLIPMLIKAIQEQQAEIEKLKLEIENK